MQTQQPAAFTATPILTLKDLGLARTSALTRPARGWRSVRRPRSSVGFNFLRERCFHLGSRRSGVRGSLRIRPKVRSVLLVDFNDQKWGGYSLAEYEVLERTTG